MLSLSLVKNNEESKKVTNDGIEGQEDLNLSPRIYYNPEMIDNGTLSAKRIT